MLSDKFVLVITASGTCHMKALDTYLFPTLLPDSS